MQSGLTRSLQGTEYTRPTSPFIIKDCSLYFFVIICSAGKTCSDKGYSPNRVSPESVWIIHIIAMVTHSADCRLQKVDRFWFLLLLFTGVLYRWRNVWEWEEWPSNKLRHKPVVSQSLAVAHMTSQTVRCPPPIKIFSSPTRTETRESGDTSVSWLLSSPPSQVEL